MASGSEVHIALKARDILQAEGVPVRVVSFPSWELFEAQDAAYKEEVLPQAVTARISVEAASTFGWHKYVGDKGYALGVRARS
jgi:transketolase